MDRKDKDFQVFKFSVDRNQDPELVAYLRSITPKPARGKWLLSAVKAYRKIERAAGYAPHEEILEAICECLRTKFHELKD